MNALYIENILIPLRIFPNKEFNINESIEILYLNAESLDQNQVHVLLELIIDNHSSDFVKNLIIKNFINCIEKTNNLAA